MTDTFQGLDADGVERSFTLDDFKGKTTVLYFYPKDNTSGCTREACDFRDSMNRITPKATVVGVSPDSVKSHASFRQKQGLNFVLLSDPDHALAEKFGAWGEKTMCGKKSFGIIRSTFILDAEGTIVKEWRKVKVAGHVDEILNFL